MDIAEGNMGLTHTFVICVSMRLRTGSEWATSGTSTAGVRTKLADRRNRFRDVIFNGIFQTALTIVVRRGNSRWARRRTAALHVGRFSQL